jgi:hypothetical protein
MLKKLLLFAFIFLFFSPLFSQEAKVIHVMVALCDNKYQGIVKVPKAIGNGQDPNNNLYWGCGYGIRTYFKKSKDWKELKRYKVDDIRLERIIFKHTTQNYYLIADAYDGQHIKQCITDLLNATAGIRKDTIHVDNKVLGINGGADILTYIGHNGLMDFSLTNQYKNADGKKRQVIILACASRQYFKPYIQSAGASPLLWTTHLMAPEAYTLYDALTTHINGGSDLEVRNSAATAYSKYQKCSLKAAKNLLVTGF